MASSPCTATPPLRSGVKDSSREETYFQVDASQGKTRVGGPLEVKDTGVALRVQDGDGDTVFWVGTQGEVASAGVDQGTFEVQVDSDSAMSIKTGGGWPVFSVDTNNPSGGGEGATVTASSSEALRVVDLGGSPALVVDTEDLAVQTRGIRNEPGHDLVIALQ